MKDTEDTIIYVDEETEPCLPVQEPVQEHSAQPSLVQLERLRDQRLHDSQEEVSRRRKERDVQLQRYGPLHQAAAGGNHVLLEYLLTHGRETVNSRADDQSTPLHLAARFLQAKCVELILEHEDVDVDAKDDKGLTPLLSAGMDASNHVDDEENLPGDTLYIRRSGSALPTVKLLVDRGAKPPTDANARVATLVHMAVARQDIPLITFMLDNKWDILNLRDEEGYTALQKCVSYKYLDVLKTILSYKDLVELELEVTLENGIRLLSDAALSGWLDGVRELLEAGAKVSEEPPGYFNVLHWAAMGGDPQIIDLLLTKATSSKNIFDVMEAPSIDGKTPLFFAVASCNRECVHHFINWGANVNRKANGNYNLIHCAVTIPPASDEEGQTTHTGSEMLLYLLDHPELKLFVDEVTTRRIGDGYFGTPLNIAAWHGNIKAVSVLYEDYHADINEPYNGDGLIDGINVRGWTPLHSAAYKGHVDVIKYIVRMDETTISDITVDGWTPLHVAAWNRQTESVKCLLKYGASLTEKTKGNEYNEPVSAIQMLLDKHPSPQELLIDVFYSCITTGSEVDSNSESFVEINYDPVMPHDEKIHFDVLMTLANCGEECAEKISKEELILHPLMETSVYLKVQELFYTILIICSIHSLFMGSFYFIVVCWQKCESSFVVDIIGLMMMIVWFHFTLERDQVTQNVRRLLTWRTWPLCLCQLLAMCLIISRFFSLFWLTDYSYLLLVPMVLLVLLRVLYYFNPAVLTTIVILFVVMLKIAAIASLAVSIFVLVFMVDFNNNIQWNEFGEKIIGHIYSAEKLATDEAMKYFGTNVLGIMKRLFIVVPLLGTYILRINPYTGYLMKFIRSKARQGHVNSLIDQAVTLENMNTFWFESCKERSGKGEKPTRDIKVYHNKKYDSKYHGSIVFGNRVWECIAEWYLRQDATERQNDRELFAKYKGVKTEDKTCSCGKQNK